MDPEDNASLEAYYDCIHAQGFDFGGLADLVSAFVSGDASEYVKGLSQANLDAVKSQGCQALLTPAMKNVILQAQERAMERMHQIHPGVGQ